MSDDRTADLTARSADRFDALADRLRDEYGDVEVVEVTWRHPPGMYDDLVARFEAGTAGGAGAWVHDDRGRVLLVREGHGWTDPGSKRRPGESYAETARRAVTEATGVATRVEGVLELHRVEVFDGTDRTRPTLVEPVVVFTARATGRTARDAVADDETVRWFAEPPDAAAYEGVERRPIPFPVEG